MWEGEGGGGGGVGLRGGGRRRGERGGGVKPFRITVRYNTRLSGLHKKQHDVGDFKEPQMLIYYPILP